jgi:hypothetical protein
MEPQARISRMLLCHMAVSLTTFALILGAGSTQAATLFEYEITGVPDFDQRRNSLAFPYRVGLPANDSLRCSGDPKIVCAIDADCGVDAPCTPLGGAMYCYPTSSMNWMAFLANEGYQLDPGPSPDWQSMDEYNLISSRIEDMGILMGVNPNGGTDGDKATIGLKNWLAPLGQKFSVAFYGRKELYCPRVEDIAKAGLAGQLINVNVARYKQGGGGELLRNGGHVMTLVHALVSDSPGSSFMRYHNPSSNDSTTEQSSFFPAKTFLTPVTATFDGFVRTQDRLGWSEEQKWYFDAYLAIVPAYILTPGILPGNATLINPVPVPPTPRPLYVNHSIPAASAVIAGALLPTYTGAVLISEADAFFASRLWHIDLVTGASSEILTPGPPSMVASGRSPLGYIYTDCGSSDVCLMDLDLGSAVMAALPASATASSIAYDDETDELVVLSLATSEILRFDRWLGSAPLSAALPVGVAPTAGARMALAPDGDIWLLDLAAATLYRIHEDITSTLILVDSVTHPSLTSPDDVAVNDVGQLIISNAGTLLELEPDGVGGWQTAASPLFGGLIAGPFLDIVRSRSNFDPASMSGDADRNVLPPADVDETNVPLASGLVLLVLAMGLIAAGALVLDPQGRVGLKQR